MTTLLFILDVVRRAACIVRDIAVSHLPLALGFHVCKQGELFPTNWITSRAVRIMIVKVVLIGLAVIFYCAGKVVRERQVAAETVEAVNHQIEMQVRAAREIKRSNELGPLLGGVAVEMHIKLKYTYSKLQNVSIFLAEPALVDDLANAPDPRKDYDSFPLKRSFVGAVVFLEQARYCPNLSRRYDHDQCAPFLDPKPGISLRFLSIACVPLAHNAELVGALCLDSSAPEAFDGLGKLRSLATDHSVQQVAELLWIVRKVRTSERYCGRNPQASVCLG